MNGYVLSPLARADLDDIWDYSQATWGEEQAERYVRQIEAVIESAAAHPRRGRPSDHVRAGYFRQSAGSHVVYYRLTRDGIDVVRILHQRMDIDRHL